MDIDATVGGTVSNSYVTLDEANAYFSSRNFSSAWEDVEDPNSFLITATNQIDWFMQFNGKRTTTTQALSWPRTDVYDSRLDEYVASDIIPNKVKYATLELVLSSLSADRFADDDMAGIQEVKIGTLKVVANSSGAWQNKKKPMPDIIYRILSGLTKGTNIDMFSRVQRF